MSKRTIFSIVTALVLVAMLLTSIGAAFTPMAQGAPLAGPTPVSVTRPAASEKNPWITITPFNATVLTADTTATCADVANFNVADVLYSIDQTDVNTITLTTKWSIDGTITATGVNVVAANAADATDMQQVQLFGRYLCVLADVTNSNPVTVTVQVMAR